MYLFCCILQPQRNANQTGSRPSDPALAMPSLDETKDGIDATNMNLNNSDDNNSNNIDTLSVSCFVSFFFCFLVSFF